MNTNHTYTGDLGVEKLWPKKNFFVHNSFY